METVNLWLLPLGIVVDVIWVLWMNAVQKEWPLRAGFWGMMTAAVGILATVDIISNYYNAIPYLVGLFIGSWGGVILKRRNLWLSEKKFKTP